MLEKLQIIQQRFDEVSDLIIQPDIIADQKTIHTTQQRVQGFKKTNRTSRCVQGPIS